MKIYTAAHVLPVATPSIAGGAVAVGDDTIVAVGARDAVIASCPEDTPVHDLGQAVILPGLINAHTHLELSWLGQERLPLGDYVT